MQKRAAVFSTTAPEFGPAAEARRLRRLGLFGDRKPFGFLAASRALLGVVFAFVVSHKGSTRHAWTEDTKRNLPNCATKFRRLLKLSSRDFALVPKVRLWECEFCEETPFRGQRRFLFLRLHLLLSFASCRLLQGAPGGLHFFFLSPLFDSGHSFPVHDARPILAPQRAVLLDVRFHELREIGFSQHASQRGRGRHGCLIQAWKLRRFVKTFTPPPNDSQHSSPQARISHRLRADDGRHLPRRRCS